MIISTLLSLLAISSPSLAGPLEIEFKCESVKPAEAVQGWLGFSLDGRNGHIELQYLNGYPPITLIDADMATTANGRDGTRYFSQADRSDGTVAIIDVPSNPQGLDKYLAKIELNTPGKNRTLNYNMSCVRIESNQ